MYIKESKITELIAPQGKLHLSEFIKELPENCIFNKGAVGTGGTTIALTNSIPTVICVPYVNLIKNKVSQSEKSSELQYPYKIFGVHQGVNLNELGNYLKNTTVPKIMVTYDSLPKLMTLIDPGLYSLLIDEYHCLLTEYGFRTKAIQGVLKSFRSFKSYTFMSATPIEKEYLLEELVGIDIVNVVWKESGSLLIRPHICKHGIEETLSLHISRILKEGIRGNHYFFVNSLEIIKKMIAACRLNDQNCRVVYSDNNLETLPIKRGKPLDEPKKINFITKTAFEGADFYDKDGKIYIISDGSDAKTLIDISTQFRQIAGRIRNSKYNGSVYHIFRESIDSSNLSFEEYSKLTDQMLNEEKRFINNINYMPDEDVVLDVAKMKKFNYHIVDKENQTIIPNINAKKHDRYYYKIMHVDYKSLVGIKNQYNKNNLQSSNWVFHSDDSIVLPTVDSSFKKVILELERLRMTGDGVLSEEYQSYRKAASQKYTYLEDALSKIGVPGIEDMKYNTYNIQRKLLQLSARTSEISDLNRVQELLLLDHNFESGSVLTGKYIKDTLNECYSRININKKAKSLDINSYFTTKETTIMIEGKQQRAYAIIKPIKLEKLN